MRRAESAKTTEMYPGAPPARLRVSAALRSCDAGEGRPSRGEPGYCRGAGTLYGMGPRLPYGYPRSEKRNYYVSIPVLRVKQFAGGLKFL